MINPADVLRHYRSAVPRYTSYPTAPNFSDAGAADVHSQNLAAIKPDDHVSLYMHIPFCDRLCWFCGCHTKHTLKYAPVSAYMDHLVREIEAVAAGMTTKPIINMLHLGGGSPSLLQPDDLARLKAVVDEHFQCTDDTEISIEIDPSDGLDRLLEGLVAFGITRASIGVQDFDPDVQAAINRPQSFEETRDVVDALRSLGVKSLNIDALYGLPRQSHARLMKTLEQCLSLSPDRMALFGYAHVPWLKTHQKMIKETDLPNSFERFDHMMAARALITQGGMTAIGIDHFAKPDDGLAIAAHSGKLRRNFQGYTTDQARTMLGFGASSIGQGEAGYVQNIVPIGQYKQAVSEGASIAAKAYRLTNEDKFRAALIERLMCDFKVQLNALPFGEQAYLQSAQRDAAMFIASDPFAMLKMDGSNLIIAEEARPFARIVAAAFDQYLTANQSRYSAAV
ncbi:MAG: oxygen-independent coproporphyrinogen III oxidase [Pseudomonadota bacterium]